MDRAFLLQAQVATVEMGKSVKLWKVVLVMAGCYSGHKAGIMKNTDNGTSDYAYNHGASGIDHYPHKEIAAMGKKKLSRGQRSSLL